MALIATLNVLFTGQNKDLNQKIDQSDKKIGQLKQKLQKDSSGFGNVGIGAVGQIPGLGGVTGLIGSLAGAGTILGAATVGFVALTAAIVGSVAALVHFSSERAKAINESRREAANLGLAVDTYQGLQHALDQTGTDAEGAYHAFAHLQRAIAEGSKALGTLKLSQDELLRLPLDQQILKIATAYSQLTNQSEKALVLQELAGKQGREMGNFFALGAAGIEKYIKEAKELGIIVSPKQAEMIRESTLAWKRMGDALNGIGNQIAVALAPAWEMLANSVTGVIKTINKELAGTDWTGWALGAISNAAMVEFTFSNLDKVFAQIFYRIALKFADFLDYFKAWGKDIAMTFENFEAGIFMVENKNSEQAKKEMELRAKIVNKILSDLQAKFNADMLKFIQDRVNRFIQPAKLPGAPGAPTAVFHPAGAAEKGSLEAFKIIYGQDNKLFNVASDQLHVSKRQERLLEKMLGKLQFQLVKQAVL